MIPSTISWVASSRSRCPCTARREASIVYATEETGSAITAKANPIRSSSRLIPPSCWSGILEAIAAGAVFAMSDRPDGRRPDFPAHLEDQLMRTDLKEGSRSSGAAGGGIAHGTPQGG